MVFETGMRCILVSERQMGVSVGKFLLTSRIISIKTAHLRSVNQHKDQQFLLENLSLLSNTLCNMMAIYILKCMSEYSGLRELRLSAYYNRLHIDDNLISLDIMRTTRFVGS